MKFLSWNVAGCHKFNKNVNDGLSYDSEDIDYFKGAVKMGNFDLICLQEALTPFDLNRKDQTTEISEKIGLKYASSQVYGKSHIKKENYFSLGNISKYKIKNSYYVKLTNPSLIIKRENGDIWKTFDVGFFVSEIDYDGVMINLVNGHLTPYHYFKRNFMEAEFKNIRKEIEDLFIKLLKYPTIIGADFNYGDLHELIPGVFVLGKYKEAFTGKETARGKGQQDHILYSFHWDLKGYDIKKFESDHHQCISDFSLL